MIVVVVARNFIYALTGSIKIFSFRSRSQSILTKSSGRTHSHSLALAHVDSHESEWFFWLCEPLFSSVSVWARCSRFVRRCRFRVAACVSRPIHLPSIVSACVCPACERVNEREWEQKRERKNAQSEYVRWGRALAASVSLSNEFCKRSRPTCEAQAKNAELFEPENAMMEEKIEWFVLIISYLCN